MPVANLTDLPPEILLEIYSYLENEQPRDLIERAAAGEEDWILSCDDWRNEEHPSLQSLRAVNKHLNMIFSALLFESVVMLHHPDSWEKVNNIATSWLAPFVKTLRIATQGDLPVFPNVTTWEEEVPHERTPYDLLQAPFGWVGKLFGVVPSEQIHWENPAAGGAVSKVDLSSRDKAYASYKHWTNGEAAMRTMGDSEDERTAPTLRLDLLPNLKRIETVGENDLSTIKTKLKSLPNSCLCCWIERSYASRRSIEASLADQRTIPRPGTTWLSMLGVSPSAPESRVMPRHGIDWGHMKLLLRVTRRYDIPITDLTLWDPRELGQVSNIAEISFPNLRRLKINLGRQILGPVVTRYSRASWISNLDNLQELIIVRCKASLGGEFESAAKYDDIIRALHGLRFPKLVALEIRNIRSSLQSLEQFVQMHSRTLRSLCVVKPRMSQEEWIRLRSRYLDRDGMRIMVSTELMLQVAFGVNGPLYTPVLK